MSAHDTRHTGEWLLAGMTAVIVTGLIYTGVVLLNQPDSPVDLIAVDGAIRITEAKREEPREPPKPRERQTAEPPKPLPRTFSARPRSPETPHMSVPVPNFAADLHPALTGAVTLPRLEPGAVGFGMDEVDEMPHPLSSAPPQYPYSAKRNRIEGTVVVRMLVTASGVPSNLSVQRSDPPGVFDQTALAAAKRWRFRPGRYKGKAVDTWVLLPFNFELTR